MKKELKWIHITDLHIGKEDNKWIDSIIRNKLIDYVSENIGEIDFIIISGDIFHRGKIDENKEEAKKIIDDLKKISINIIFCAGNHDFRRRDERTRDFMIWNQTADKKGIEKQMWEKFKEDFSEYVEFCYKTVGNGCLMETGTYVYDLVEGINIVVLNTCIFAGQPKYDDNGLVIKGKVDDDGKLRFLECDMPDRGKIRAQCPTIVVGHHALQMFDEESKRKIIKLNKNVDSIGYFCGHMHRNNNRKIEGIEQYVTAGLFDDDNNIPSVSMFTLRGNFELSQTLYVYKAPNWIEDKSFLGQLKEIGNRIEINIKKFFKVLRESFVVDYENEKYEKKELQNEQEYWEYKEDDTFNVFDINRVWEDKHNKSVQNFRDKNIGKILEYAYQNLLNQTKQCDDENSQDWYNIFFHDGKYVSKVDMQFLWGKLLASKIMEDDSVSKRTLNIVKNLSADEAKIFMKLIKFVLQAPDINTNEETYDYFIINDIFEYTKEVSYTDFIIMQDAGLININFANAVVVKIEPHQEKYIYINHKNFFSFSNLSDEIEERGANVFLLTKSGRELYDILADEITVCEEKAYCEKCKNTFIKV